MPRLPGPLRYARLPFVLRFVIDPIRALDLLDQHEIPDHTKIVPFLVIAACVALQAVGHPFGVLQMTVLCSASFGAACFRMFLRTKTVTGTATDTAKEELTATMAHTVTESHVETKNTTEQITRSILERRDPDLGVDPTHD